MRRAAGFFLVLGLVALLSACGGGGGGAPADSSAPKTHWDEMSWDSGQWS